MSKGGLAPRVLRHVLNHIDDHLHGELGLGELAKAARIPVHASGATRRYTRVGGSLFVAALDCVCHRFDFDCSLSHLLRDARRAGALVVERDLAEAPSYLAHVLRIVIDFGHALPRKHLERARQGADPQPPTSCYRVR